MRTLSSAWIVMIITSCALASDDPDDDTMDSDPQVEDTPIETDSEESDTVETEETVETVDTDTGAPRPAEQVWDHAINQVALLPEASGFDVDGDGDIDNALGGFSVLVNNLIAGNLNTVEQVAVVQTWGVNDGDDLAQIGLYSARDTDNDLTDNFTGTEVFEAGPGVGPLGRAVVHATATLDPSGTYQTSLSSGTIQLGPIAIPIATDMIVGGTTTATSHEGRVGGAVDVAVLEGILNQVGLGAIASLAGALADIDTDGDTVADAVSVAFSFSGVPCDVTP